MILSIINILQNNSTIKTLLDGTAADYHIYPLETTYLGDCIVYDCVPVSDDKIQRRDRLQIVVIAATLSKAIEIEEAVKNALLTFGDNSLTNNILKVQQNGGGSLYDSARKKNHRILYFDIITRREN